MAKRGRKPKEKKGYFYEAEEDAIVRYIESTDEVEKNKIFNEILYPALTTMIESIIRRYGHFIPDEEFSQNFNDTLSYLFTKIDHYKKVIWQYDEIENLKVIRSHEFVEMDEEVFRSKSKNASETDPDFVMVTFEYGDNDDDEEEVNTEDDNDNIIDSWNDDDDDNDKEITKYYKKIEKRYKAYSYCGTVCRNYLKGKKHQYIKRGQRNVAYEDFFEEINNDERYAIEESSYSDIAQKLIVDTANEIEKMVNNPEDNLLNDDEIKVGNALITLLREWEEVLPEEKQKGSKKLQKSTVLYYLREETLMTTKEVRDNMKKYKCIYKLLKKIALE